MKSESKIIRLVEQILHDCNIGHAPVPIEQIPKHLGLFVVYKPLESTLSSCLYRNRSRSVIGINTLQNDNIKRLALAHQIGHFLLHDGILGVDRSVLFKFRNTVSSENDSDETEANLFANEILMPRKFIARGLESVDTIDVLDETFLSDMSKRYKVSSQTLLLRLNNLGYIL